MDKNGVANKLATPFMFFIFALECLLRENYLLLVDNKSNKELAILSNDSCLFTAPIL